MKYKKYPNNIDANFEHIDACEEIADTLERTMDKLLADYFLDREFKDDPKDEDDYLNACYQVIAILAERNNTWLFGKK